MNLPPLVPPLKCQGIKTKLAGEINRLARTQSFDRWVEPFCGSCVVALNVQPKRALLSDSNVHIIRLYQEIQNGTLTPATVKSFLVDEGDKLRVGGESYYYAVRDRFNLRPTSLDFLFLNRSCFNGVMRFNRHGRFNVPYGHKSERFAQAYVTKIVNQVRRISEVISACDWEFVATDFRQTLAAVQPGDLVYADPPYAGRHVDYFNTWSESDETELGELLKQLPCHFILSTWHSNEFRTNVMIERAWNNLRFHLLMREHFYHVGSTEDLRHPMIEALITNFPISVNHRTNDDVEQLAFLERSPDYHVERTAGLQPPTRDLQAEAASAGFYEHKMNKQKYPRIRLRTVKELMDGKSIERLSNVAALDETFKKAPKAKAKGGEQAALEL